MNRFYKMAAVLATVTLFAAATLAPDFAEAAAGRTYNLGGGSSAFSQGSRGSRTYNYNGAQPMQRSMTPRQSPYQTPLYGGQPGYSSFGARHPFLTGLAGGFFGSWIGSMLFPHFGYGGYGYGGYSVFGSILSWLLIIGVFWFVIRLFTGRSRLMSQPDGFYGPAPYSGGFMPAGGYGGDLPDSVPLAIVQADYQAFEAILKSVQGSWSTGDLATLRHYVTPEMLSYFSEALAQNESQGVVNHVENVELIRGDLREAWDEGRMQYATTYLLWRALDYTTRNDRRPGDPDYVVSGNPQRPTDTGELWTFARSPGGHWLLSAIQQV